MKKNMKLIAFICLTAMIFTTCAFALSGCGGGGNDESQTSEEANNSTVDTSDTDFSFPAGSAEYSVTVKSIGGLPFAEVTILVYSDETLETLIAYGATDENGIAKIQLDDASIDYRFTVVGVPDGYVVEEKYAFTGINTELVLSSEVIEDTDISEVAYTLGSVMHDFTLTDTDGNTHTLSKLLEEKEMVMLNFWYSTCSPCLSEFPYINEAYLEYQDKIEILAINSIDSENESAEVVSTFKAGNAISFPMLKDFDLAASFNVTAYPTTVLIDRYGVVCLIEEGAIPALAPFTSAFDLLTAEDYKQVLYENMESLVPVVEPDTEMPSSEEIAAVISSDNNNISYAPETGDDADMTWAFEIAEKDGIKCIKPSNEGIANSFATIYVNVKLKAGEAIRLDYYASSSFQEDILHVLVDREAIYQISGEAEKWETCYPFVALEDGEYELALCYMKSTTDGAGDDSVYIKNISVVDKDAIDVESFIPRDCATDLKEDGFGYKNYVEIVFNEKDGYYHVGTKDGPLLLADLMNGTKFSNTSVNLLGAEGELVIDGVDLYAELVDYCNMAVNSELYGLCTVNEELKELLVKTAKAVGIEQSENEWLQICSYYDVYGGASQISDPIKGLSAHSAYEAHLGNGNEVTYNRVIMPRGLWYKFVPATSGVYRITSASEQEVEAWIFLADGTIYNTYEHSERMYDDLVNCSMVVYMEAGKEYFIDIAFRDIYAVGSFTFEVKYEAASMQLFSLASQGYFTFIEGDENATISGGIDITLGDDGYYHELLPNGQLGSVLYADFIGITNIFSTSLMEMTDGRSFNFELTEDDQYILDIYDVYGDSYLDELKKVWGNNYEANMELLEVEDVLEGDYHGDGDDLTNIAEKYAAMANTPGTPVERQGCVPVNEELGDLLQQLMDKFTFKDVEYSWGKLCYYYDYIGPDKNK